MEILCVHLTVWLLLGSAVIVSSQPTIYPSEDIYVREGSPARFLCSFSSPGSDALSLSVGGLVVDLTSGVGSDKINQSQMLGVLGGSYTVLVLTTSLAQVEFTFNGTRALNGYTLQCISKNRFDASAKDNVSQIITIHVEYPPSPSVKNETFNVFLSRQPTSFQLNCSDLLTGNPLPNVTWTYDMSWKFSVTPNGPQNSLLSFQIDSLDLVPPSLYLQPVTIVCTASNKVGSTAREITLNVSGTPSAPQRVGCAAAATEDSSCVVKCTWNAPVVNGSSNVISYDFVIKRGGEEVFHNKTDGARTEYSIPTSAFDKSNEDLTVYVKAVSALGPGPESSNTFKSPGPCMKPSLSEGRKNQTFVTVNWTTPDCNNLPVNTIRVNAAFLNGTSVFFRDVNSQTTSLLIGPLNPDTEYKVYVTIINCAGQSDPAELTVTILSGDEVSPSPTVSRPLPTTVKPSSSSTCLQTLNVLLCFVFLSFLVRL